MSNVKNLLFIISLMLGLFPERGGYMPQHPGSGDGGINSRTAFSELEYFQEMSEYVFLGILISAALTYTAMFFMGRKRREYLFFVLMCSGLSLWLLANSVSFRILFPFLTIWPMELKLSLTGLNLAFIGFNLFYSWYRGRPRFPRVLKVLVLFFAANNLLALLSPAELLRFQNTILILEAFVSFSFVLLEIIHKIRIRAIHPLGFFPGLSLILLAQYMPLIINSAALNEIALKCSLMVLVMQQLIYHTYLSLNSFSRLRVLNRDYARVNQELKDSLDRIEDQSELIHYMSSRDRTTGLANRSQISPVLERETARLHPNGPALCFVMAEWEDYKRVLHRRGLEHLTAVIRILAERLTGFCRERDWVCRYSDDRFLLILPLDSQSAAERTDELFRQLKKPIYFSGSGKGEDEEYVPRMILGFTVISERALSQEALLRQLFASLDYARKNQLSCPCGFEQNIDMVQMEKARQEAKLKNALKREQLNIYYQPQHESWQYAITGMEALIRWNDPELGHIPPENFIPLAEEMGLIEEIDLYVLRAVLNQLNRWQKTELRNIPVSVNISPANFVNPSFIEDIIALTESKGIAPSRLELELTETILVYNHGQILKNIHRLKEAGFSIALDDFGTGYSSLAYLSDFPVDVLKIDKAFVNNLLTDRRKKGIVNSIIAIGRALGMRVISEGVEKEEELHYLRKAGSHTIQGYYFSPALPAGKILDYIRKTRSA